MVRSTTSRLGDYQLLERISVGGMAEIYRAQRCDGRGPLVALKRILPHLARDTEFVQMFIDESRTATQLHHPNICRVFESGEDQGTRFLVMELIEGRDLKRVTEYYRLRGRPMPLTIALHIMSRTCDALDYAHGALGGDGQPLKIVHRDVTPQNILISFLGEVKLIDFGIAKATHRIAQTQAGNIKGKLSYLAPEQIDGRPATHRSDLFACGIVLHEILTNSRLFAGDNDLITIDLVRRAAAPPPSRLNASLPRALDAVVLRALSRSPEARYSSAGELRDALDAIAVQSGNVGSTSQVVRWMNEVFAHDRLRAEQRVPGARSALPASGSLLFASAARSSGLRTLVDDLASELTPGPEVIVAPEPAGEPLEEPDAEPAWLAAPTAIERVDRRRSATASPVPAARRHGEPQAPLKIEPLPASSARPVGPTARAAEPVGLPAHDLEPIELDTDGEREVTVPRTVAPLPFPASIEPATLLKRGDETGPPTPAMAIAPALQAPFGLEQGRAAGEVTHRRARSAVLALVAAIVLLIAGGAVFTALLFWPGGGTSPGSAGGRGAALEASAPVSHALADARRPPERAVDLSRGSASVADLARPDRAQPRIAPRPSPRPPRRTVDAGRPHDPLPKTAVPKTAAPKTTGTGFLIIASRPWARVWIDGTDTGRNTPIPPGAPLRLSAGKHRVTLQVEEQSFDFTVTIDDGATVKLMRTLPATR